MSELIKLFLLTSLVLSLVCSFGYGFYEQARLNRQIRLALVFGWGMYFSTLTWLVLALVHGLISLIGLDWLGTPWPWWKTLLILLVGLALIGLSITGGRKAYASIRSGRKEEDPHSKPENWGIN